MEESSDSSSESNPLVSREALSGSRADGYGPRRAVVTQGQGMLLAVLLVSCACIGGADGLGWSIFVDVSFLSLSKMWKEKRVDAIFLGSRACVALLVALPY